MNDGGERVLNLMSSVTISGVVKGFFVVGLGVYFLFAIVILRQAMVMSETIEAKYNWLVKIFAWTHLVLTGLVLWLVVVFL